MDTIYKKICMALVFLIISFMYSDLFAATIYVDNGGCGDCATYRVAERDCGSGSETVYDTIQEACTASSKGDTIYIRGGTYNEHYIDVDPGGTRTGTAWTAGNYTTIASYPGEWAIIDGQGNQESVFRHISDHNYGYDSSAEITAYWKFERLEVKGGRVAFRFKEGPIWIRYCYIHDNVYTGDSDEPYAGVMLLIPSQCILEYNYFYANRGSNQNLSNPGQLIIANDYRDSSGNGDAFEPDLSTNRNIVRYNYFDGNNQSRVGIHHKNQQRFGYNNRDPRLGQSMANSYSDWGDDIHHNVVINHLGPAVSVSQDFGQIHHNIVKNSGNISAGQGGDVPIVYNICVYNNTFIGSNSAYEAGAGLTTSGNSKYNYYDSGGQQTVHPHLWYYNNISSGGGSEWHQNPWIICWDMPADTNGPPANPDWDFSDLTFEKNLIHDSDKNGADDNSSAPIIAGHQSGTWSGCDNQYHSVSGFNSCSDTWRSTLGITNWDKDGDGLFKGSSGPEKYKTVGTFGLGYGVTISNGGIGGNHPYLSGVTLPSYVGATNPNKDSGLNWDPDNPDPDDAGWVDYVLNVVNRVGPPSTVKNWKMKSVVKP